MTAHQNIEDASDPLIVTSDPFEAIVSTVPEIETIDFGLFNLSGQFPSIERFTEQNETNQWISEPAYMLYDDLNDTSLYQNDIFTLTPDVMCTLSGGDDVIYSIDPVISWISIDSEGTF